MLDIHTVTRINNKPVPLERRFSPVSQSAHDSYEAQFINFLGNHNFEKWPQIDKRFRSVYLAGAGKTFGLLERAEFIRNQGHQAFFIRIKDIAAKFELAFEVESKFEFEIWLDLRKDVWFFSKYESLPESFDQRFGECLSGSNT